MYVAAACHLFVSINSTFGSCTYGLASILAEDIRPRASCTCKVYGKCDAHIPRRGCHRDVDRLLSSRIINVLHQIIQYVSSWFWILCRSKSSYFIRSFSSQVIMFHHDLVFIHHFVIVADIHLKNRCTKTCSYIFMFNSVPNIDCITPV